LARQLQDGVCDRELGLARNVLVYVFPDPERRRLRGREASGEVVEEPPEVTRLAGERVKRLEAVDDDHARLAFGDECFEPLDESRQPPLVEKPAEVLVEDG